MGPNNIVERAYALALEQRSRWIVLPGLGGCGKSFQIAVHLAWGALTRPGLALLTAGTNEAWREVLRILRFQLNVPIYE